MKCKIKCTKCKGVGKFFPPDGITKADMVLCNICKGTGQRPDGYVVRKKETPTKVYLRKSDGLDSLNEKLRGKTLF